MVMIKSALTTPTAERTLIVAEQIRATSMDIVRPLSHTLARRDVFAPITPAGSDGPLQLRFISATEWRQVVRDTFLIRPISPVVVPALFFISSSGFVMGRYGFVAGSVALAAEAIVMGAVLWGCRWYLSRARLTRMSQRRPCRGVYRLVSGGLSSGPGIDASVVAATGRQGHPQWILRRVLHRVCRRVR